MFNKPRDRVLLARMIGLLPFNSVRCFFYRWFFGYRIKNSRIDRSVVLAVDSLDLEDCVISGRNKFLGPMKVVIMSGAFIESNNTFSCGWWTASEKVRDKGYERELNIGCKTRITSYHYFDVAGSFNLGDGSWIAGRFSQFWTHGAGTENRVTKVGQYCYIGSATMFSPGVSVGNNCLVALGSVVTRSFPDSNVVLGGNPAKVIKENYDWKSRNYIE